ncbi:TPA: EscG/YscG/SsaH family type III secretion system needle protein co-chaperone, partial [Escherichia coli]|nr:EscG/YscG/SsaH family type III secretion system needle protein co-chaperone [Escherichia coli]
RKNDAIKVLEGCMDDESSQLLYSLFHENVSGWVRGF